MTDPKDRPKPWMRQPGESTTAFSAFCRYRDMAPHLRSLAAAYRDATGRTQVKRAPGAWNHWWSKFKWSDRADAWDDEQDRVKRETQLEEVREMGRQHAQVAGLLINRLLVRVNSMGPEDAKKIPTGQIAPMLQAAVHVERLARGVHTDKVVTDDRGAARGGDELDLTRLGDDELAALDDLLGKARRAPPGGAGGAEPA